MQILGELRTIGRSISNNPVPCFDELFVTKRKKYEGRVGDKRESWHLKSEPIIKFWDNDNPTRYAMCKVTGFITFVDAGEAYDLLGQQLMPDMTRDQVVYFYNHTLGFEEEIKCHGFVALKLEILQVCNTGLTTHGF